MRDGVSSDVNQPFLLLTTIRLVICAADIANATLATVLERAGKIGLRRAIGTLGRLIATTQGTLTVLVVALPLSGPSSSRPSSSLSPQTSGWPPSCSPASVQPGAPPSFSSPKFSAAEPTSHAPARLRSPSRQLLFRTLEKP